MILKKLNKGLDIWIEDTNVGELFRETFGTGIKPTMGQGVANNYRFLGNGIKPMSRQRVTVGRGIAVKETPSYKQFGKYAIHIPQLEQQDILNVKYKSLGQVPKFKPTAVSDIFRDFLLDLLDNGKPNVRTYQQIAANERKLFEEMSIGAGVWNALGLKRTTTSTDDEENKRFELLKGEYMAGNNNPKVISELRRLVVKMIGDGRIKKSQGMELLMELSI
jgi:ribosomal protein L15